MRWNRDHTCGCDDSLIQRRSAFSVSKWVQCEDGDDVQSCCRVPENWLGGKSVQIRWADRGRAIGHGTDESPLRYPDAPMHSSTYLHSYTKPLVEELHEYRGDHNYKVAIPLCNHCPRLAISTSTLLAPIIIKSSVQNPHEPQQIQSRQGGRPFCLFLEVHSPGQSNAQSSSCPGCVSFRCENTATSGVFSFLDTV